MKVLSKHIENIFTINTFKNYKIKSFLSQNCVKFQLFVPIFLILCFLLLTFTVKSQLLAKTNALMNAYRSQDHSTFANTLKNSLASTYPSYYFTVSVYNQASGWDNHAITGFSYQHVWRQYGRNVAVTYVKKSSRFPSSTKKNEIVKAVLNEITQKVINMIFRFKNYFCKH